MLRTARNHSRRRFLPFLLVLSGCGSAREENAVATAPTEETRLATSPPPGEDLIFAADRREPSPLLEALASPDVRHRRAAAWLFARVPVESDQIPLAHAVSDMDPTVRAYAASALAAHERALPAPLQDALLGALAAETNPSARVAMLAALGRIATTVVEGPLEQALAHGPESERVVACRSLGQRPTDAWPNVILERASQLAADDALPSVREACWFGLGRTPIGTLPVADLRSRGLHALADSSPEIRGAAARVVGRIEADDASRAALVARTRDSEWRVAVQALRALQQTHPTEAQLLQTLTELEAHWWPTGTMPTGGALHVLLTALDIATAQARATAINTFAASLHTRASRPLSTEPFSRDQALLHCAAARLVDYGRGWPTRVESCGLGQVTSADQAILAADVLAHADGAAPQRETFLRRLYRSSEARVREAVLAAVVSLPPEVALNWALQGLRDPDPGVVIAALELATSLASNARQARDGAAMQAALEGHPLPATPLLPTLVASLQTLQPHLAQQNHPEALATFHRLVALLADPATNPSLAPLVAAQRNHAVEAVRTSALEAERALGIESISGEIARVPNPITQLQLNARVLRLTTSRGEIEIQLDTEIAPTTVTRIAELAESGFYDGLNFHRVVPGFVVQGGDPRGDGYGDAGWSQRCEDPPTPYERGTVGMALAGRDTGGSQFFIATGPAHHLDGRYTAFGHVTRGIEVVDLLQAGDRIDHAVIERGEHVAPYPAAVLAE